jgi:uncharacterized membrane protein
VEEDTMMIIGLLLVGIVVYVLLKQKEEPTKKNPDAWEILKNRYAQGEISREAFLQMKEELKK